MRVLQSENCARIARMPKLAVDGCDGSADPHLKIREHKIRAPRKSANSERP